MKQAMIILTIALMLFSCRTYKLTEGDLEWQPYKEGDRLVFESNIGEMDTLQIENIELHKAEDDPLAVFPDIFETQYVTGKRKALLSVRASKNGSSTVSFDLMLGKKYMRHPTMYFKVDELLPRKHTEPFGKFTEYCKVEAKEQADNMKDVPFDLRYIYWSKEYGYLGLEFKDNYMWTLKAFIRDGKNIL